jgi:hypothetical protein
MDNRRRYLFAGNAAAFGGQIVRPNEFVIEAHGASSLPVTGGKSVSRVGPPPANDFFHVDSAETFAEGFFEDPPALLASAEGKAEQDALVAVSNVRVHVKGFSVGRKFKLTVKELQAELLSRNPHASGQPGIRVGKVVIDGVAINGYKLRVKVDSTPFDTLDTHAKLLASADDPEFVKKHGDALFMRTPRDGSPAPPPTGRLIQSDGTVYSTIVKSIEWDGAPYPGSRIEGNRVILEPDFGVLHFGELLTSPYSKRLTMVRAALGSEGGGSASGGDVEGGGQWAP